METKSGLKLRAAQPPYTFFSEPVPTWHIGTPSWTPAEASLLSGPQGGWDQCTPGQRRKDVALL